MSNETEKKSLHFDVLNVREKNPHGMQRQTLLRRCYEKQLRGTYDDEGANLEPYRLSEGWTYAVLINGVKIGDMSPEDSKTLADLVQSGWRIVYSSNNFDSAVDVDTGEAFYTCKLWVMLRK